MLGLESHCRYPVRASECESIICTTVPANSWNQGCSRKPTWSGKLWFRGASWWKSNSTKEYCMAWEFVSEKIQFWTHQFRNICIVYLQLCRKHSPGRRFLPIFHTGKGCQDNRTRKYFPYAIPCIVPVTFLLQTKKLVIRKGSEWSYWQLPLELPFFYCMVGSGMGLMHPTDGYSQFGLSQWKSRHGLCTPHLPPPWTPQTL